MRSAATLDVFVGLQLTLPLPQDTLDSDRCITCITGGGASATSLISNPAFGFPSGDVSISSPPAPPCPLV